MSNPWMKFYPRDWRGDQALGVVSVAARGFWIDCLCIMHEAKPYGHLLINGRPVGDDVLARLIGSTGEEVRSWKTELREAGVCDETSEGVIFSRRMVRDQQRSAKGKKAVQKRWTQAVEKQQKTDGPNRSPKSPPNRGPTTQKPEARSQNKEKEEPKGSSKKKVRGTRLPRDWILPDGWRRWAMQNGVPPDEVGTHAEQFRDYWIAQTGRHATKADWQATWRNWIRNIPNFTRNQGNGRGKTAGKSSHDIHLEAMFEAARDINQSG